MNPTPTPDPNVTLDTLFEHIKIRGGRSQRAVVLAWILATRNNVPAPILVITGPSSSPAITRLNDLVSSAPVLQAMPDQWWAAMEIFAISSLHERVVAFGEVKSFRPQMIETRALWHITQLVQGWTITRYDGQKFFIRSNAIIEASWPFFVNNFSEGMSHLVTTIGVKTTSEKSWEDQKPGIMWALLELDARVAAALGSTWVDTDLQIAPMREFCRILDAVDQVLNGTHGLALYRTEAMAFGDGKE